MPKAIISNRIYLNPPDRETYNAITKQLTYKFVKNIGKKTVNSVEIVKTYKVLSKDILSLPQGRHDLIPEGYDIEDKRVTCPVPFPDPKFPLFDAQKLIYDQVEDTCFINALVGWGKTFTALHIAHKLKQKTLVITHTVALRDQWIAEAKNLFGTDVGVIGGGAFDIEDHFIVIGNIQSLKKYAAQLSKEFGTLILDEAHHCPATTFTDFIDSSYARFRVALSGTLERKDGKHTLFGDYFGSTVYRPPQSNTLDPVVKLVKTNRSLKPNVPWVDRITDLTEDVDYQKFIAHTAKIQVDNGHSVLIIADRVEFLEKVHELIGKKCVLVTGNTSLDDRNKAKEQLLSREKMCVAGSRQIFSEGISINILSCVILAVPLSNQILLEQIVGRIMRPFEGKNTPLVLDMQFAGWADKKQNNERLGFYMKKGWDITSI